jgi:hypothetical protein
MKDRIPDIVVAKKLVKLQQSALSRGLEFDLKFHTVRRLLEKKTCTFTKIPFEESGPLARSIDRIDSAKGYIEGNVVACTVEINGKKANLSIKEIQQIYSVIKNRK